MTGHDPKAIRAKDGHFRWSAACPCGWRAQAHDKDTADRRAAEHRVVTITADEIVGTLFCECYEPESMEYGLEGHCTCCRVREAIKAAA